MIERLLLLFILVVSVTFSVLGVVYGVVWNSSSDAGRGGALADALALFTFFCMRAYADNAYIELSRRAPRMYARISEENRDIFPKEYIEKIIIESKIKAIETKLRLDAEGQSYLNWFLSVSAAIGTIFWGFGDIFSQYIIDNFTSYQIHHDYSVRLF